MSIYFKLSKVSIQCFILLIIYLLYIKSAFALDCKVINKEADALICSSKSLMLEEEELNELFKAVLGKISSEPEKVQLKKAMDEIFQARNMCVDIPKLPKISMDVGSGERPEKAYKVKKTHYQQGCISSWYNTVKYALVSYERYNNFFIIPSRDAFISTFSQLKSEKARGAQCSKTLISKEQRCQIDDSNWITCFLDTY